MQLLASSSPPLPLARLLKATAKGRRERGKGKICLAVRIVAAKDAGFTDKSTLTSVHLDIFANECLKTSFPFLYVLLHPVGPFYSQGNKECGLG